MKKLKWVAFGVLVVALSAFASGVIGGFTATAVARSQVSGDDRGPGGIPIEVASSIVGDVFTVYLQLPAGRSVGDGPLPVVWVTDGTFQAEIYMSTVESLSRLGLIPEMAIVAIPSTPEGRSQDFRPSTPDAETNAADFLALVRDEVMSAVRERLESEGPDVFVGYSLGGLFSSWAFTQDPDLFDGWIAMSPSWWFGDGMMTTSLSDFALENPDLRSFFYTSMGDSEGSGMITRFDQVNEAMSAAQPEGLTWVSEYTRGADHGTNPQLSSARALMAFWEWYDSN